MFDLLVAVKNEVFIYIYVICINLCMSEPYLMRNSDLFLQKKPFHYFKLYSIYTI